MSDDILQGILLKLGEKGIKTWKKRYFAVRTGNGVEGRRPHLYYYEKREDYENLRPEKGRIDLGTVLRVEEAVSEKNTYEFNIITATRTFSLRATSSKEMQRWVSGLQHWKEVAASMKSVMVASESVPDFRALSNSNPNATTGAEEEPISKENKKSFRKSIKEGLSSKRLSMNFGSRPNQTQSMVYDDSFKKKIQAEAAAANTSQTSRDEAKYRPVSVMPTSQPIFDQPRIYENKSQSSPVVTTSPEPVLAAQTVKPTSPQILSEAYYDPEPGAPSNSVNTTQNQPAIAAAQFQGWNDTSSETKALRKKLNKAMEENKKYEEQVRYLKDDGARLRNENNDLKQKLDEVSKSIDIDKNRREAELLETATKLTNEMKKHEDLQVQYNEMRKELRALKKSIHLAAKTPALVPVTAPIPQYNNFPAHKSEVNTSAPAATSAPLNNTVNHSSPSLAHKSNESFPTLTPAEALRQTSSSRPGHALSRDAELQKSYSVRSFAGVTPSNPGAPSRNNPSQPVKQVSWVPDQLAQHCCECKVAFSFFTRRHHCRACGEIFCDTCTSRRLKLPTYPDPQRVCRVCFNQVRQQRTKSMAPGSHPPVTNGIHSHTPSHTRPTHTTHGVEEDDPPVQSFSLS